jgi:hypothetical protein
MKGMKNILQQDCGKNYFYLVVFTLAVIMIFLASGAAINIDEIPHNEQAKKVVNWYATSGADVSCLEPGNSNLNYYGQLPDNISAAVNQIFSIKNEFATRHYVGLIFALLLLIGVGLLAKEIAGNYFIGITAMVLMFVSPRIMGQAYGNLKDIPFAAGYAWSLLLMVKFLKSLPAAKWKTTIWLGIAIAFTNSVRIGGLVLFGYFALFLLVFFLCLDKQTQKKYESSKIWIPLVLKLAAVVVLGYFGSLVFWPYGLMNPLKNPIEALKVMEHYKISIRQVFEGGQIWSTNLPWYYLLKWLLISIPEIVFAGLLFFILFIKHVGKKGGNEALYFLFTGFAFIFPLFYVVAIKSNLYSGWRQMYFIYAPMVVLASAGLAAFYHSIKMATVKIGAVGLAAIFILIPVFHTIKTYPSEYIYFNLMAGSSKDCWENYEYDYYRHEMKKAASWLKEELKGKEQGVTVASNFEMKAYFPEGKNIKFRYVHFYDKISEQWDYALLGVNYIHPYQLKNNPWQPAGIVKTFYHRNNPTVIILKGQDKNAWEGYLAMQNKNFAQADSLLGLARKNDPADLGLLACLGESSLALNNLSQLQTVIGGGLKLNPFYEPFLLLDARLEITKGDYQKGLTVLKNLAGINPRYFKAVPYLIECYEKTGDFEKAKQLRNDLMNTKIPI